MRIDGHWLVCRDGILRPVITASVRGANDEWHEVPLLVDTGADESFLTAEVFHLLHLESEPAEGVRAEGIGGNAPIVLVPTALRMVGADGKLVLFKGLNGRFCAFTAPGPLEMSFLGRDILNFFAVIVYREGDIVSLIRDKHRYVIQET